MTAQKLLILDDDAMIGDTIERIARTAGFESKVTQHAEAFFRALDSWQPSHIALDLIMPEMDGVEVMVELARRGCRASIIITSGVGSRVLDAAARSAAEHGLPIAGVVSKPFSPEQLRELLLRSTGESGIGSSPAAEQDGAAADIGREELETAIEEQQISLVYQPKVHCRSRRLAGFEALVRWNSPERGLVLPSHFIPVAESCGLIGSLTRRVITGALDWFGGELVHALERGECSGSAAGHPGPTLSINLSARSLDDTDFVDHVAGLCEQAKLSPHRIVFELTETSAMEDPVSSLDLLTRLRMKGFQLSIDDFGTGYSSMLQLVRLPFSEIKVDKSFVMSAARSPESRAVIRSIIELGHSLGLQATAEGVEDQATLDHLTRIGCNLAQGYLIARPLTGEQAMEWTTSHLTDWK